MYVSGYLPRHMSFNVKFRIDDNTFTESDSPLTYSKTQLKQFTSTVNSTM
jgi:hypothetical protein